MTPPVLPWVILPYCQADRLSNLVQLYEPYSKEVTLQSQPASLTIIGGEQPQAYGPGLYTSLHDVQGEKLICNFLDLSTPRSLIPPSLYAKKTISICAELTDRSFSHMCVEFSDLVCIRAQTVEEAVRTILSFGDCIKSNISDAEVQFYVFLEGPPCQTRKNEIRIKNHLQTAVARNESASQWVSRVLQRMIVRSLDPKVTMLSDLLTAVHPSIIAMKKQREEKGHLWTLQQLMYLFEHYFTAMIPFTTCRRALPNLASSWPGATWYPMAFRRQFWPGRDIRKHNGLTNWFRATNQDIDLNHFLAPIFARMFLEDADLLPQGFSPTELFASMYEPLCRDAWYLAAQDCDWINRKSYRNFSESVIFGMSIPRLVLRREALIGVQKIGSKSLCCLCPWDKQAWILLPCGHGLCERDALRYSGIPLDDIEYPTLSHLTACPVCRAPMDLVVRHRPLQAGYRVATLDGGGTLGFVSLVTLRSITEGLPPALSIHHYFDVIVGTSTGSIISAAVGIMHWPLEYCIYMFSSTATEVFTKKPGMKARVRRWIRLHRVGAKYDKSLFCNILKNRFGDAMMRAVAMKEKQDVVRVVIAATTFDSKLYVYRSHGDVLREGDRGNYIPQNSPDLRLWQAVAASCAAPLMFEPPDDSPGDVFDGLFAANCPAWVAKREINEISMLGTRMLDFLASFGTGQFLSSDKPRSRNWLEYIIPEWISRLGCCLGRAVDADSMYEKFSNTLDSAEKSRKHHRVEPCFTRSPVAPDDPTMFEVLETETEAYMRAPETRKETQRLQLAMLASCFYGALLSPPTFDSSVGQYCAHLAILSRWPEDFEISKSLDERLANASFLVDSLVYSYKTPLYCTIYLSSLDIPLEISLTLDGKTSHPISGFPLSITEVIYLQRPPCSPPPTTAPTTSPCSPPYSPPATPVSFTHPPSNPPSATRKRRGSNLTNDRKRRRCKNKDTTC